MTMANTKKYVVDYCSGATGYGWSKEYDRLDEFESFIDEMRREITAHVSVWDNTLKDFIFYKRALCYEPETDMLKAIDRDMRTKNRKWK
jgi:hypothetical protein